MPSMTSNPTLLTGHTVFITGAGQGIGAAVAMGLAGMGAHLIASDVSGDAAERTAQAIRDAGGIASSVPLDVANAEACNAAAAALQLPSGHKLVLVNNAGVRPKHAFDSADRDEQ
mgnify:FL=1